VAVREVAELQAADPTPVGAAPVDAGRTRVVARASVVLLSSHFERYVYAINEEAARVLNESQVFGDSLPEDVRLLHSKPSIDGLLEQAWESRAPGLTQFVASEAWLWREAMVGVLEHERFLSWMKAPTPHSLLRYYRYWGIQDIFEAITRQQHTRTNLWLKIDELVRKRNNIAHGDATTEATTADVRSYREATRVLCERAERQLARALAKLPGVEVPW
jgi:hypothetical protein